MADNVKMIRYLISIAVILTWLAHPCPAHAKREHLVFFKDTPYELNVYKIMGRKDGPTMMIVGGIQGDEPGGFLSADLYIDLALSRGNLIVVPRANFHSILQFKRGTNGDMNRKFGGGLNNDKDSQIVRILEELMAESDIFLNLHDGWGYYRPVYVSKMANPMRYGQSIIADCEEYVNPRTGQRLNLKNLAEKALAMINAEIDDPNYHFHFMNTSTFDNNSPYKEMRKSATYYALTKHGIPAFGVETSKNLPTIEMKVRQHNLAINAFMEIFGLKLEQPGVYIEDPKLDYLVISVNDQIPVAVADGQTLYVKPHDSIEVVHVESNYERGLSVDILEYGTLNDFRQVYHIDRPTAIVAQKDHLKFGRVPIEISDKGTTSSAPTVVATKLAPTSTTVPVPSSLPVVKPESAPKPRVPNKKYRVKSFIIEVNGRNRVVPTGTRLDLVDGDKIRIMDIKTEGTPPSGDIVVNFKGFVGDPIKNTGEDRGYLIDTARDLLARYSLSKKEKIYEVVVELNNTVLARITIRLIK